MYCGERWSHGRVPDCQSRGWWFNPICHRFEISFTSHCLCLLEETLKAGGPFYLVSMSGEVKYASEGVNVWPVVDSLILENSCVSPSLGCLVETTWVLLCSVVNNISCLVNIINELLLLSPNQIHILHRKTFQNVAVSHVTKLFISVTRERHLHWKIRTSRVLLKQPTGSRGTWRLSLGTSTASVPGSRLVS